MKKPALLFTLIILAVAATAAVAPSKLLPANGDVKGWNRVDGARIEVKGENLTEIYNGGYKLYLDNGVTVAARDLYMKDNVVMEVTVHTMKSKDAANKFFEYWRKEYNPQAIDKQKTYSMFISRKPAVGWMVSGIYLVSAVPSKDGEQQIKDTKAFLHQVRKKIETAQK